MSESHDAGPAVTVIVEGQEAPLGGEGGGEVAAQVEGDAEGAEVIAEVAADVAETGADATVLVAEIEANRDITIAAINAETTEAMFEASHSEETERWRLRAETLEAENLELRKSIPPRSEEPPNLPESPASAEGDGQRASPEEAPPVEEPPPPKRRHHRWI
jgi:hypothetical protein